MRALTVGDAGTRLHARGVDGTDGRPRLLRSSEYRGQLVVLVFYPADNTPVCTRQLHTLHRRASTRSSRSAPQVLAISPQYVESHADVLRTQGGFAFPLLADPDKAVGRAYGILGLLDFYRRSTFVVDAEGEVVYVPPVRRARPVVQAGRRVVAAVRLEPDPIARSVLPDVTDPSSLAERPADPAPVTNVLVGSRGTGWTRCVEGCCSRCS